MTTKYKNNHYVPKWYQKQFLLPGQIDQELYYLTIKPEYFTDQRGISHPKPQVKRQGFRLCFSEDDLYTLRLGNITSSEIEQNFFGQIDVKGRDAVRYFENYTHPSINNDAFHYLLTYMSTQKLRTPKGLEWLSSKVNFSDKNHLLTKMIGLRNLHCAIWTECIWQIADATRSATKFIVSDHPVTIYNRECGPRNRVWCRGANDPDITLIGSHTLFPLSFNKILILTNLSWIRNPYQSALNVRPNPYPFRSAMFKYTDIQTMRFLSEQEVREINFITKSRAYCYIGAAKEDWLFPEKFVSKANWNTFGNGYLLMPDPRCVEFGGELLIGYQDGTSDAFDAFGRKPWDPEYNAEDNNKNEFHTLHQFKGEFAHLMGAKRRGRSFSMAQLDPEEDSDKMHQYYLSLYKGKGKGQQSNYRDASANIGI